MPVSEPLRRSPRLSLSPTPTSSGQKNSPHNHNHNSLALIELPDPQPLKIYHPSKPHQKPYLLHASSSSPSAKTILRRSPRLLGASIGVSKGQCGSELLLNLPEKKACQLARVCLDDSVLTVKSLRSRNLRITSSSPPVRAKRKLDSGRSSEETPVNRGSVRRSPKLGDGFSLALSSSSMAASLGKCRKLEDYTEEMSVNRGFVRRSPRFSGQANESNNEAYGNLVRECEDAPLALPSSSMPVNRGFIRRSPRFSGQEAVESPARKELIGEDEGERVRNRKNSSFSEEMPLNREFLQRSSRFSGQEAIESPTRKGLIREDEGEKARNQKSSNFSEGTPVNEGRIEIVPLPLMKSIMEEIFGENEEERVLRRSPRGLSSICMVDDYECDEMKDLALLISKKKKEQDKATKERRREKMNVSGSSPSKKEQDKATKERSKSCSFVGDAVPQEEAHQRWQSRYDQLK